MENMTHADLWQEAQDRVLLYLKMLGMPAILSLELAHEALVQASDRASAAGSLRPTQLAMGALQELLTENDDVLQKTVLSEYPILYRRWYPKGPAEPASCQVQDPDTGLQAAGLPPIARASMIIKRI